jgi:hypothetical protein
MSHSSDAKHTKQQLPVGLDTGQQRNPQQQHLNAGRAFLVVCPKYGLDGHDGEADTTKVISVRTDGGAREPERNQQHEQQFQLGQQEQQQELGELQQELGAHRQSPGSDIVTQASHSDVDAGVSPSSLVTVGGIMSHSSDAMHTKQQLHAGLDTGQQRNPQQQHLNAGRAFLVVGPKYGLDGHDGEADTTKVISARTDGGAREPEQNQQQERQFQLGQQELQQELGELQQELGANRQSPGSDIVTQASHSDVDANVEDVDSVLSAGADIQEAFFFRLPSSLQQSFKRATTLLRTCRCYRHSSSKDPSFCSGPRQCPLLQSETALHSEASTRTTSRSRMTPPCYHPFVLCGSALPPCPLRSSHRRHREKNNFGGGRFPSSPRRSERTTKTAMNHFPRCLTTR